MTYKTADEATRVVYECEAMVGAATIVGNELAAAFIEKRLKDDNLLPRYESAYKKARDVLRDKLKSCNDD